MEHPEYNEELQLINSKILSAGEVLPEVMLRDGTLVQTGTVATLLYNIRQYDLGARGEIEHELELAIPTLFKVGLFDLFPPHEWLNGERPGRRLVGRLALKYLEV